MYNKRIASKVQQREVKAKLTFIFVLVILVPRQQYLVDSLYLASI